MTKVEKLQDQKDREMVTSELLRMLEDVANREIPCQVAYANIQDRLIAARAEGFAEGNAEDIEELAVKFKETLAKARAKGAEQALSNPISRGILYVNAGGVGDLPDGQYSIIRKSVV